MAFVGILIGGLISALLLKGSGDSRNNILFNGDSHISVPKNLFLIGLAALTTVGFLYVANEYYTGNLNIMANWKYFSIATGNMKNIQKKIIK